ncbi:unnamed protein product [Litomosoides sigmodontis]|uniref:Uncharacterized protein n=1 Tax=Litomosoides sigmodontis TaxID=42156 RepID=A0A3P6SQZ7_LITSI|nr:unnamed protein product [Litomosoides sigmodontis]
MSSDVLPKFASLEKSRKTCEKKMESESDMMSSFSSVTNATSTRDDDEGEEEEGEEKISSKKLDFAERILKWEQLVTPNVNRLHYNRAIGVGKRNWRDVNEWSKSKANVKLCATEPFFDRSIVAHFSRDGGEVGGGERIGEGGGIKGRKGSGAEAEEVEKVEGEVSARRSAFAVEINDEREAVRKKLAAYHPHLLAQTSVRGGTEIASGHCYPTTTTIATAITTSSTPSTTALALPQSRSCCGNTSVSEHCSTTGSCDKTKRMILAAVEDASSSQSSDENSNSSRLRNVHAEINSTKNEDHRKEEEQREKVEEGDDDISVPIQLIRQSSEEGFNQVVKFKTRVARKGEAEDPKQQPKSSTHTEFNNEQGKLSSKKKKIPCAARRTSKGLANEGLDNRTTCVKQNSSGDIQFESEYCDPTEKTCRSTSANDDNGELKIFNCDAICAKSEGIRETTTNVDHSSQSMRKQQHQQKCDEAEISAVIGDPQTDDKSEMFV